MNRDEFGQLPVVCPECHGTLALMDGAVECTSCSRTYEINHLGYLELLEKRAAYYFDYSDDDYATDQESSGGRLYDNYLKSYLEAEHTERILDVGCGVGIAVSRMLEDGRQAYGLDLPSMSRYWSRLGHSPAHFYSGDAATLPFPSGYFDMVMSLGVIEHIGTVTGHSTLSDNYWETRQSYANELLRVTREDGRVLISCPNKSFPIDIQHPPSEGQITSPMTSLRTKLYAKTGLNAHWTMGRHHLLSYAEVRRLFRTKGGARHFRPLPLKGYFGFGRFDAGILGLIRSFSEAYVSRLPSMLRPTALNPYMLVEIRK